MKKTISINISGILFHIEEDGYLLLSNYLESINNYFAAFDESREIVTDIENRIAEIFLGTLKPGKQVVTADDVSAVIAKMGEVKDFQADEESQKKEAQQEDVNDDYTTTHKSKKLFRDPYRNLIGGVASGIAQYFRIDPIWIRLGFLILFFGFWFIHALTFITFLSYVALWILLPEKKFKEDDQTIKKLFRNPDDRIIRGVCSGLAAYFGTDVHLFRIVFAISIFLGGAGIIIYIIFCAIVPEAKSMTDKMQMEGEPVTLSNIVQKIKKDLNIKDDADENIFAKLFLAPFRLASEMISGSGKVVNPLFLFLFETIRISIGIVFVLVPFTLILILIIIFLIIQGYLPGDYFFFSETFPVEWFLQDFPKLALASLFLLLSLPLLSMAMGGISTLAKRRIFHRSVGWIISVLFILSIILLMIVLPPYVFNFRKKSSIEEETLINNSKGKIIVLKTKEDVTNDYTKVRLKIISSEDTTAKLVRRYLARGKNKMYAKQNAASIQYVFSQKDSVLSLPSNFTLPSSAHFRAQELELTLYLPIGQKFILDESMEEILPSHFFDYGKKDNTWISEEKVIKCITCPNENTSSNDFEKDEFKDDFFNLKEEHDMWRDWWGHAEHVKNYPHTGFSNIDIDGAFDIQIIHGNKHQLYASGQGELLKEINVNTKGKTLEISMKDCITNWRKNKMIKIYITTPQLEKLDISGATKSVVTGFQVPFLNMHLSGASSARVNIIANTFYLDATGASKVVLKGKAKNAEVTMSGASEYRGFDFKIKNGNFNVSGASTNEIYTDDLLKIESSGVSKIRYKGHPKIVQNLSFMSRIYESD